MCGIVGIYYFDPSHVVDRADLERMADAIVHRGPDDAGFHVDGNVGIGMRRLSIIDLAGGHQPIFSADARRAIVFNGEMYNFQEQRAELERGGARFGTRTDTEVMLRLYETYGEGFLEHANGMYGLAIWDAGTRTLELARDRLGIKPLYYYQDERLFAFASEIKALLALDGIEARLDHAALGAYLRYGFTPAPMTLFRGIRKLPAAHRLRIVGNSVRITEYWRPSYRDKLLARPADLEAELYDLLGDAVRYQLIADVPLGAFLSGGIDSSGIVHLMRERQGGTVNTYSIGFGAGFDAYNELEAAGRFARDYGANHHEILVTPDVAELFPRLIAMLDEPVADSSFLVTYLVARLARESVKVILSGVGGDELFGGYRRYLNVTLDAYFKRIPGSLRRAILKPLLARLPVDRNSRVLNTVRLARAYLDAADLPVVEQYGRYTTLFSDDARAALAPGAHTAPDLCAAYASECDSDDPLDRIMYFDLKTSLPEQLLMLTDKMTMATSLEARVPYLDHRVVEFAARIPTPLKIRGFGLRRIQKAVFAGRFPPYVLKQRKKGFGAPIGTWIRGALKPMVTELLGGAALRDQGLFDAPAVGRLLDDHYALRADHTDQILALLAFQLWCSAYRVRP